MVATDCQDTCYCTHQLSWIILGIVRDTFLGVRFAVDLVLSCQAAAWLLLWMGDIGLRMLHGRVALRLPIAHTCKG